MITAFDDEDDATVSVWPPDFDPDAADSADVVEQARVVELDDEEYR